GGAATLPAVHRAALERKVVWELDVEALKKDPPLVLIRPAKPIPGVVAGGGWRLGGTESTGGKMIGRKQTGWTILMVAYRNSATEGDHPGRMIVDTSLPTEVSSKLMEEYDYIASTSAFQKEGLQRALKEKFNLTAHWESRETNVSVLRARNAGAPGLK